YNATIELMIERGLVSVSPDGNGQDILVPENDGQDSSDHDLYFLLCSMLWPFISTYWAASLAFITASPITEITKKSDISNIDLPEGRIPTGPARKRSLSSGSGIIRPRSGS